ncbi:MAG TPA: 50S ribosomal protein L19 [Candidatus Paceibacterota bacterium]|nr:50S ribosomal protein L19 [Candidatus Paceibacterota bacterium]
MATATKKPITLSTLNTADRQRIDFRAGDTVRVSQKIQEKGKTRLQVFEGLVLARKHGNENGATFTVRRVAGGYGVEKIFPLYSPLIDKIEVVNRAKVRRAKLYYVREKAAKEISRQMRRSRLDQSSRQEVVETPTVEAPTEEKEVAENTENQETKS